jgi:hypothetical protein
MAGFFESLADQSFVSTNSVTITHGLNRIQVAVVLRIGGAARNDLIQSITPDILDPRNKLTVVLTSVQTGSIALMDTDLTFANIPTPEDSAALAGATANPTAGAIPLADGTGSLDAWVTSGTGDVTGPASSIDQGLVRFNGTTGKIIEEVGLRNYGKSATDPVTPAPAEGDLYFNTVLNMQMFYDSSRSKWLSVETCIIQFGRNGNTGAGAFFRGLDRRAFTDTIGRNAEYDGTIVSLTYTRSNTAAATFEVTGDGTLITTASLLSSVLKGANVAINGDFTAGQVLGVRNQAGGDTISNVLGWVQFRWRV